jgi:enoyl-CoA hydratase
MEVLLDRQPDHVAIIRIANSQARNALTGSVRDQLAQIFIALAADDEVRCAVLTGTDTVFAAGADIKAMAYANPIDMMMRAGERTWAPIKDFPKPLIAAVNGLALGGGCELAMHADIIVAGESARFGQPEIKLGIIPGAGGTQRLVRAVGKFKAMKILLTGDFVSAREAEAMGLVTDVVPDTEVLDHALTLARSIAALPPLAARKIKELVLQGSDLTLDAGLALERHAFQLMFGTADQKEGMQAFLEKRPPRFTGC